MPRLTNIQWLTAALGLISFAVAYYGHSQTMAIGVAAGCGLGVLNFYALRRLLGGIAANTENPPRQAALSILLMVKLALTAIIVYGLLRIVAVHPIGFLLGISSVVVAIFIESARSMLMGNGPAPMSESRNN